MIVAKHTRIYGGRYRFANDVVNPDTGMSTYKNYVFKFLADRTYRFAHVITHDSIISFSYDSHANITTIKYSDVDNKVYTLTIKKPYILTKAYTTLLSEINKFVKEKDSITV